MIRVDGMLIMRIDHDHIYVHIYVHTHGYVYVRIYGHEQRTLIIHTNKTHS